MLRKLAVGPYQSNCYILGNKDSNEGIIIDPGDEVFRIIKKGLEEKERALAEQAVELAILRKKTNGGSWDR